MKEKEQILITADLRKTLKELFANELKKLPDYFKELQTKEKLDYLITHSKKAKKFGNDIFYV